MPGGDERVVVEAWSLSYARIGAAGRVVRRERYRGSSERAWPRVRAAHSAAADSLLTLPSPPRCSSTEFSRGTCGPRSTALLRERGGGQRGARAAQRA